MPGFLVEFITPIVKVTKGSTTKAFYTIPQYEAWKESTGNNGKGWKIKYYKGMLHASGPVRYALREAGSLRTHLKHQMKCEYSFGRWHLCVRQFAKWYL